MSVENLPKGIENYNRVLFSMNSFMVEQTEIGNYNQLVSTVVDQLDKLFRPIAVTFSEYDEQCRVLRIKEIKANQGLLDFFLKNSGKKLSSVISPVSDHVYEEIKTERVKLLSTLHEITGRAVPKTVSSVVSKALGINCYLGLSYVVDDQVFGTTVIALREEPDQSIMELLKAYAYFTSLSLKRILADQALNQSEQELRTIADNMTDLVSMSDTEGRFTFLSGNHYDLFGYGKEELLGRYAWEIIYEEDMAAMAEVFTRSITAGEDGRAEYRVVRKDGTLIWVETVGSILNNDGQISGALFVSRDITDRKKAEEDLRITEQELKMLINNITDVVAMADFEGKFVYISQSSHAVFGYHPEELIGRSIIELVHEDDVLRVGITFQDGIAEGKKSAITVHRVRHKNGHYVWVEALGK